jgi:hypothetical protein
MQNLIALGSHISHPAAATASSFWPGCQSFQTTLRGDGGDGGNGITQKHDVRLLLLRQGSDAEVGCQQTTHKTAGRLQEIGLSSAESENPRACEEGGGSGRWGDAQEGSRKKGTTAFEAY